MTLIDAARELTRTEIEEIPGTDLVSNERRDIYQTIRAMKLAKVMAYHDAKRDGSVDAATADAISSVLKTDIAICDILTATDFGDAEDTGRSIAMIRGLIVSSPRPDSQESYLRSLNENEASMELTYLRIMEDVRALAVSS